MADITRGSYSGSIPRVQSYVEELYCVVLDKRTAAVESQVLSMVSKTTNEQDAALLGVATQAAMRCFQRYLLASLCNGRCAPEMPFHV